MRIVLAENYDEMSCKAANIVAGQIYLKPDSVLGLATGSTPLALYKELVRMHHQNNLDFSEVKTFNLDEYIGLNSQDKNSYYYYMYNNLFNHINIKRENVHIPDGMGKDMEKQCIEYEKAISESGGIDLQLLGIGNNGHIGFNEPDQVFETATHVVKLDHETIEANSRYFERPEDVPRYAVSMGIKTIMQARKILLLVSGKNKSETVYKALKGAVTPEIPASILQLHPDVTVIAEESCAGKLREFVTI